MPVVRTDGWSVSRCTVMCSWMGSLSQFFTHGVPLRAFHACESSDIKFLGRLYLICSFKDSIQEFFMCHGKVWSICYLFEIR